MFAFKSYFSINDFVKSIAMKMGIPNGSYRVFVDFYRYPKPRVRVVVQFPRVVE